VKNFIVGGINEALDIVTILTARASSIEEAAEKLKLIKGDKGFVIPGSLLQFALVELEPQNGDGAQGEKSFVSLAFGMYRMRDLSDNNA
jgi:hypothetical protein